MILILDSICIKRKPKYLPSVLVVLLRKLIDQWLIQHQLWAVVLEVLSALRAAHG